MIKLELEYRLVNLTVALAQGQVQVTYHVNLETDTYQGDIGGGEVTVHSPEIAEKVEELRIMLVRHLRSETGLLVEEGSLEDPLHESDGDDEDPL
jgi:hypothetical protein